MRLRTLVLGAVAAVIASAGSRIASPVAPAAPRLGHASALHAPAALQTGALSAAGTRALADEPWRGGAYTTSTGETVTVYASTAYADPEGVARRWASYFASLEHGAELRLLRAYVAPLAEVQTLCPGDGEVLGCYGGGRLVTAGEVPGSAVDAESVAAHEYGHHVAANRVNPPWSAVAWGTKRWASYEDVCRRAASGTAYPGDESSYYQLNPGEAFAETYRVLSELRAGAVASEWPIVDPSFRPAATALRLVEEDVLHPYAAPAARIVSGRFTRRRRTWTLPLAAELDGDLRVTLRLPPGAGHELSLVGADSRVLARGLWSGSGRRSLRFTICGQRSLTLRVARRGAAGRFTLVVQSP